MQQWYSACMFVGLHEDSYSWVSLPPLIEQPEQTHCLSQIEMSASTQDYPGLKGDLQFHSNSTEDISDSNKVQNSGERVLI